MCSFSGYYDHSTHLLHILHGGQHYYIEWPKRSRDYIADTTAPIHSFKWKQWAPTRASPYFPSNSFVIDI
jgi:hypothetical protein